MLGWVMCPEHGEVEALAIEWTAEHWQAGRRGRWHRARGDCGCVIERADP